MIFMLGGGRTGADHIARRAVGVAEGDGGGHRSIGEVVCGEDGGDEAAVACWCGHYGFDCLCGGEEGVHLDVVGYVGRHVCV